MAFSIFKIHKTIFEKKAAKEIIQIEDLKLLANSEEYGTDAKQKLRWAKYINNYCDFIEVWYKPNKSKHGRLEAELSMCDEKSEVRSTICGELYHDIDGVNMGYQIFYQAYNLFTSSDPTAPALTSIGAYIEGRDYYFGLVYDEYFKMFDRDSEEVKKAIKEFFIRLLNDGSIKQWKIDYGVHSRKMIPLIGLLEKEIKAATKKIFEYIPAFQIKSKNSDKDTISHFIYETEKKCVEQLIIALGLPETYMYCKDGIMVLKSQYTEKQIEDIIEVAKQSIFNLYGLFIDFKIKPMPEKIKLDELTQLGEVSGSYDAEKIKFEQKYCKIKNSILFPFKDTKGEVRFHTEKNLIGAERDFCPKVDKLIQVNGKDKIVKVRFVDEWLDDSNKKQFDDVDIYPTDIAHKCPSNIYNLWTPFLAESYEPCPEDECIDELEFLLNHILILCNHEKVIYDYFIRWFGQMLKYPSKKTTAPTFISEEGAGKGSLFELFRKVLGDKKVLETTNPEKVVGKFNILILNAFLVIFNELEQHKIKQYGGDIKGFITDKSIQIEGKGTNPFQALSYHRLLNATNVKNGGLLNPHQNDRRNVIIECSDELCNNKEYFDKFYECIENKKLIRKFYDYCYNLDGLEKLELPPKTEHHQILIDGNVCKVKEFMKDCTFSWAAQGLQKIDIPSLQLYQNFKTYIDENGFKYETNTIHFVRQLGYLKIPKSNSKSKGSRCMSFNIEDLIKYFDLKRNEEQELILEEKYIQEPEPLERIEKIILPRHKIEKKVYKEIIEPEIDDEPCRLSFDSFLEQLLN